MRALAARLGLGAQAVEDLAERGMEDRRLALSFTRPLRRPRVGPLNPTWPMPPRSAGLLSDKGQPRERSPSPYCSGNPDRPAPRQARRTAAIAASLLRSRDARVTKPEEAIARTATSALVEIRASAGAGRAASRPIAGLGSWPRPKARSSSCSQASRISPDHVRRCLGETGTGGCASTAAAAET